MGNQVGTPPPPPRMRRRRPGPARQPAPHPPAHRLHRGVPCPPPSPQACVTRSPSRVSRCATPPPTRRSVAGAVGRPPQASTALHDPTIGYLVIHRGAAAATVAGRPPDPDAERSSYLNDTAPRPPARPPPDRVGSHSDSAGSAPPPPPPPSNPRRAPSLTSAIGINPGGMADVLRPVWCGRARAATPPPPTLLLQSLWTTRQRRGSCDRRLDLPRCLTQYAFVYSTLPGPRPFPIQRLAAGETPTPHFSPGGTAPACAAAARC